MNQELLRQLECDARQGDAESVAFADGIRVAAELLDSKVEWLHAEKAGNDLHAELDKMHRMYSSLLKMIRETILRKLR